MAYYLFSAVHRCPPCKALVELLNDKIPDWKNCVIYVDVDNASEEHNKLAVKLGIRRIPSFTFDEQTVLPGTYMDIFKKIKEICIQE